MYVSQKNSILRTSRKYQESSYWPEGESIFCVSVYRDDRETRFKLLTCFLRDLSFNNSTTIRFLWSVLLSTIRSPNLKWNNKLQASSFNATLKLKCLMASTKSLTGAVLKREPITRRVQLTDQDIFSINFDQFSSVRQMSVKGSTVLYACASILRYKYKKKK